MATPAENLAAARAWIQAMVERDPAKMGAMAAEDVKVLEVAEGEVHEGRDYLVWAYEDLFSAYPDCTCEIINAFRRRRPGPDRGPVAGHRDREFSGPSPRVGARSIFASATSSGSPTA